MTMNKQKTNAIARFARHVYQDKYLPWYNMKKENFVSGRMVRKTKVILARATIENVAFCIISKLDRQLGRMERSHDEIRIFFKNSGAEQRLEKQYVKNKAASIGSLSTSLLLLGAELVGDVILGAFGAATAAALTIPGILLVVPYLTFDWRSQSIREDIRTLRAGKTDREDNIYIL